MRGSMPGRCVVMGIVLGLASFCAAPILAQTTTQPTGATANSGPPVLRADPSELGLALPKGEPKPGGDRRILVRSDDDEVVVAKVLVEVGDHFAALMPDGRIQAVPTREATITYRPFVGASADELKDKLTKKFPGFTVQATKHFIYVYNSSAKFYQGTSGILESMYPGLVSYLRYRKVSVVEPEYPLVVVMFKTRQAWEDYMHGMFAGSGVAAFYDGVTNRVLMYEQSDLADIAPELALKECISTVAHEGVHQILHNIGVQQRLSRWPMWFSEGLPEYFSPTSIGAGLKWKGVGQVNDLRMRAMADNIKTRTRPAGSESTPSLTEWIIATDKIDADGYAWSWALTHYLGEKRREQFNKYLTEVTSFEALKPWTPVERKALFIKHFGDDFKKHDADLLNHLYKLPYVDPIENMTHYVVLLDIAGRRAYAMTPSQKAIQEIRQELLDTIAPKDRNLVQFNVRSFGTRSAAKSFVAAWASGR